MLGEKVGWVSKMAFFILKNKVKIWTVCPFHSYIIRMPGGRAAWRPGRGWGEGPCSRGTRHTFISKSVTGCHYLLFYLIIFLF